MKKKVFNSIIILLKVQYNIKAFLYKSQEKMILSELAPDIINIIFEYSNNNKIFEVNKYLYHLRKYYKIYNLNPVYSFEFFINENFKNKLLNICIYPKKLIKINSLDSNMKPFEIDNDGEFEVPIIITQEGSRYFNINNIKIIPNDNTNIKLFKDNQIYKEYDFNEEITIKQEIDRNYNCKLVLNEEDIYIGKRFAKFELLINGNCKVIQTISMIYDC